MLRIVVKLVVGISDLQHRLVGGVYHIGVVWHVVEVSTRSCNKERKRAD